MTWSSKSLPRMRVGKVAESCQTGQAVAMSITGWKDDRPLFGGSVYQRTIGPRVLGQRREAKC